MNDQSMSSPELLQLVQTALADVLGGSVPRVQPETPLASLELDSVRALELTAHFEDRLGLILSNVVFSGVKTVGDLTHVLQRELDKVNAAAR